MKKSILLTFTLILFAVRSFSTQNEQYRPDGIESPTGAHKFSEEPADSPGNKGAFIRPHRNGKTKPKSSHSAEKEHLLKYVAKTDLT